MPDSAEPWVLVATAASRREAMEIAYALDLRSIRPKLVKLSHGLFTGKSFAIEVAAHEEQQAREALHFIIQGMAGPLRASTAMGECPYCGYDLAGLPSNRPCPECGRDLSTPEAREQARKANGL